MHPHRHLVVLAATALLASCGQDTQVPMSGPLTQQDVTERAASVSTQLQGALLEAATDEGVLALQGFPQDAMMTHPLFGYGLTMTQGKRSARLAPFVNAFADNSLPRGRYRFEQGDGASSWTLVEASDDLSLTWPYSSASGSRAEATLTLDWNALSPTATVRTRADQGVEVPTGLNVTLLAGNVEAADLDITTRYYNAPGCAEGYDGILEPTALSVSGSGSLLTLADVGFSTDGATTTTSGEVTLTRGGLSFDWTLGINGEQRRGEDCFTEAVSVDSGNVDVKLSGLPGDTESVALRFDFGAAQRDPQLSNGALVINGDESRAVTFSGSLADDNTNGVPGDSLIVTFPDGSSTTLEALIEGSGGGVYRK